MDLEKLKDRLFKEFVMVHVSDNDILGAYAWKAMHMQLLNDDVPYFSDEEWKEWKNRRSPRDPGAD